MQRVRLLALRADCDLGRLEGQVCLRSFCGIADRLRLTLVVAYSFACAPITNEKERVTAMSNISMHTENVAALFENLAVYRRSLAASLTALEAVKGARACALPPCVSCVCVPACTTADGDACACSDGASVRCCESRCVGFCRRGCGFRRWRGCRSGRRLQVGAQAEVRGRRRKRTNSLVNSCLMQRTPRLICRPMAARARTCTTASAPRTCCSPTRAENWPATSANRGA